MKRPTRKTRAKPQGLGQLNRATVNKCLVELSQRLDKHLELAEAIAKGNTPNGEHMLYGEYRLRLVFGVLLENQLQSLHDIHGLAHMLSDRVRS
jgi:hypothetical protein